MALLSYWPLGLLEALKRAVADKEAAVSRCLRFGLLEVEPSGQPVPKRARHNLTVEGPYAGFVCVTMPPQVEIFRLCDPSVLEEKGLNDLLGTLPADLSQLFDILYLVHVMIHAMLANEVVLGWADKVDAVTPDSDCAACICMRSCEKQVL